MITPSNRSKRLGRRGLILVVLPVAMAGIASWYLVSWLRDDGGQQVYGEHAYTDEDLGIPEMVLSFLADENHYARYRTDDESSAERREEDDWFDNVATGHRRERSWFELQMWVVMAAARQNLPEHLGEGGVLGRAYRDALDECAASAGYPGVRLYDDPDIDPERLQNDGRALRAEQDAEFERYEREYGLDYESFVDLRHECHKHAGDYPTLPIEQRDRLLSESSDHFVRAIRRVISEHPEHAVPVEWHPGAPQPWADHLVANCLAAAEGNQAILEECAEELRVEIPDM